MTRNFIVALIVLSTASVAVASYVGPFLLWGIKDLNDFKLPALAGKSLDQWSSKKLNILNEIISAIDEKNLKTIYSKVKATLVFTRNLKHRLSEKSFPSVFDMVKMNSGKDSLYLTQKSLPVDPKNAFDLLGVNMTVEVKLKHQIHSSTYNSLYTLGFWLEWKWLRAELQSRFRISEFGSRIWRK